MLGLIAVIACGSGVTAPGLDGAGDETLDDVDDLTPTALSAATLTATSPTTQSALAGTPVADPPSVVLRDRDGQPIANQEVRFSVSSGGGALGPEVVTTDAQGRATLDVWELGKRVAPNAVRASVADLDVTFNATVRTSYTITVQYVSSMTTAQRAAFDNAAARWSAIIISELPNFQVRRSDLPDGCARSAGDTRVIDVDDMIIFASIAPIDGQLGVLAQAMPCAQHQNGAIAVGVMAFDSADIAYLESNGQFEETILHEMGHVIGIGSVWALEGLIASPSVGNPGANTRFTGAEAAEAYVRAGGTGFAGAVPVENSGQEGSADAHWRESIFRNELMSPSIDGTEPSLPLSAITVASLRDLGFYDVNDAASDTFVFPIALTRNSTPAAPIFECTMSSDGLGTLHIP